MERREAKVDESCTLFRLRSTSSSKSSSSSAKLADPCLACWRPSVCLPETQTGRKERGICRLRRGNCHTWIHLEGVFWWMGEWRGWKGRTNILYTEVFLLGYSGFAKARLRRGLIERVAFFGFVWGSTGQRHYLVGGGRVKERGLSERKGRKPEKRNDIMTHNLTRGVDRHQVENSE